MVLISANAEEIAKKEELVQKLCEISPLIVSIILNVNKILTKR